MDTPPPSARVHDEGRARARRLTSWAAQRLRVDPIACKAHAVCAELFPERIRLDDWGYPILDERPIPPDLMPHARRAIGECPRAALRFVPASEPGTHSRGPG